MTEHEGELRGSTPVYTAKDVLVSLDRKVGEMDIKLDGVNTSIQIFASQNLNARLVALESSGSGAAQKALTIAERNREILTQYQGAAILLRALVGANALTAIVALVALVKTFGVF